MYLCTSTEIQTTHLQSPNNYPSPSTNAYHRFLQTIPCSNQLHPCRDALKRSKYDEPFTYQPSANSNEAKTPSTSNSTRRRNIIWFNPPFSKSVKKNVGKIFLNLIDKHFPPSNPLHKVFNRNNVKVSYSCMENMKSTISNHNHELLSNDLPASA